jgi:hypothetical protein
MLRIIRRADDYLQIISRVRRDCRRIAAATQRAVPAVELWAA